MVANGETGLAGEPSVGIRKARAAPGGLSELEQVSPERTLHLSLPEPGIGIMALLPCRNQTGSVK